MIRLYVVFTLIFPFLLACSTLDEIDTSVPEGAYKMAQKYEEVERYEEAINRYTDLRTKFPYSKYAVEAQLRIADIQFKRQYYIEAATAYQVFREYYPRHPETEFIIYRTGLSYYLQLPSTIDRDLSPSSEALRYFDQYLEAYPNGKHVKEVKEKKLEIVDMLIDKQLYVGNYYMKQKQYLSALGRFQDVYQSYPETEQAIEAAYYAFVSALELEYRDIAKKYLDILAKRFPDTDEYDFAKERGQEDGLL